MKNKINESIMSESIREDMKENRIDHMTYMDDMEVLESDVAMQVLEAMGTYDQGSYTASDVQYAIYNENRTLDDFGALLFNILGMIGESIEKENCFCCKLFDNSILVKRMHYFHI